MILVVSMNRPEQRASGQSPTEPKCKFEDLTGSPVLVQHFTQTSLRMLGGPRHRRPRAWRGRWPG